MRSILCLSTWQSRLKSSTKLWSSKRRRQSGNGTCGVFLLTDSVKKKASFALDTKVKIWYAPLSTAKDERIHERNREKSAGKTIL